MVVIDYAKQDNTEIGTKTLYNYDRISLLLVGTVLVNNFVLVKFFGLVSFHGRIQKLETAIGMGLATTFVLTFGFRMFVSCRKLHPKPLGIEYLRTMSFILVIAVVVQFTEMVVHKTSPTLYRLLGIFLPLITTNCAVLGVVLLNINETIISYSRSSTASALLWAFHWY